MDILTIISKDEGLVTGVSTYQGTDEQFDQIIKANILKFHQNDEDLIELIQATDDEMVESVYGDLIDEHELYLYEYLMFDRNQLIKL